LFPIFSQKTCRQLYRLKINNREVLALYSYNKQQAKWHVRVSKQPCKQGNRLILWASEHHFFSIFFLKKTWKKYDLTDPKCLNNIHSHLDLKSLSFSTESTNVL
jgi:hypothetical protein